MTNHYGSTSMASPRDRRRAARKLYRRSQRKGAAAHRSPSSNNLATPSNASTENPVCTLSNAVESICTVEERSAALLSLQKQQQNEQRRKSETRSGKKLREKSNVPCFLSVCDNAILLEVASFVTAGDLHALLRVDRRWRWTLLAHDSFLWKPHCLRLWSGRYLSSPDLLPFVHILGQEEHEKEPRSPELESQARRTTTPPHSPNTHHPRHSHSVSRRTAGHPTGHYHHSPTGHPANFPIVASGTTGVGEQMLAHSWREALCRSLRYSGRNTLARDDLQFGSWEITFNLDTTIPPQPIRFFPGSGNGAHGFPHVRTEGFPQMPYALYENGSVLHVHVFPELKVRRDTSTWQWTLGNHFVRINSAIDGGATASLSLAQLPLKEMDVRSYLPSPFSMAPPVRSMCTSEIESEDEGIPVEFGEAQHVVVEESQPADSKESSNVDEEQASLNEEDAAFAAKQSSSCPFCRVSLLARDRRYHRRSRRGGEVCPWDPDDPPPDEWGEEQRSVPCVGCISAMANATDAGHRVQSTADCGASSQRVGSALSTTTCALFGAFMAKEDAKWERLGELRDLHVAGAMIKLLHGVPGRPWNTEPAHLLDQGRPRRPP